MTPSTAAAAQSTSKRATPAKRPATAKRAAERAASRRAGPSSRTAARTAVARAVASPAVPARVAVPATRRPRPATRRARPSSTGRRISGPSRGLGAGVVAVVAAPAVGIARRASLQRLASTRAWIGLVAFALIGIVTMQLLLLELNTGIGHTLERTTSLQRANAALSVATSEAGSSEAIETKAREAGMVAVAPGELHPISAAGSTLARKAARALRAESSSRSSGASTTESTALASTATSEAGAESTETGVPSEAETLESEASAGYEAQPTEAETTATYGGEGEAYGAEGEATTGEAPTSEAATGEAEYGYTPGVATGGGVAAGSEG